jgi:TonB family protein
VDSFNPSKLTQAVLLSLIAHGLLLSVLPAKRIQESSLHGSIEARLVGNPYSRDIAIPREHPRAIEPISFRQSADFDLATGQRLNRGKSLVEAELKTFAPSIQKEKINSAALTPDSAQLHVSWEIQEGIKSLRLLMARTAKSHVNYPGKALHDRLQGAVLVVMRLTSSGHASYSIKESSGYEFLDAEAVRIVNFAFQQVILPQGLRSQSLEITFPIDFRLEHQRDQE